MTFAGIGLNDAALWFAAAIVFVIAEIVAPGFFLIFLGVGAGLAGLVALVPGVPILVQAFACAVFTAVAVAFGWRWYRGARMGDAVDPLLNDRAARLIGQRVMVCEPIVAGTGRVTVADGSWPARGPDMLPGAYARVIAVRDGALLVEPAA